MREQSRERILTSALELFARHGFANTSVRMIAERAGVSQGLLYNYFESKRALLGAILVQGAAEVRQTFEAAEAATPSESLAVLIRAAFDAVRRDRAFWSLTYQIRLQPEVLADVGPELIASAREIRERIGRLLAAAGTVDASARAHLVFAVIDGVAQHYVLDPEGYPIEAVTEEAIRRLVLFDGNRKEGS